MDILSKFSEIISDLVADNELNPRQITPKINLSKSALYLYVNGDMLPSSKSLAKLADYFNCTADFLLGLEVENHPYDFKPYKPFKEVLPVLLQKYGINKYKLQKITGFTESAIYKWQRGATSPTVESLVTISEKLGCTVDFLLGRE